MSKRKEHIFIDGVECKHCSKCGEYKPLNEFDTCTSNWDKLQRACKSCRSIYGHSEQRKQYNKQYYAEHTEEIAAYCKQYRAEHADYFKQYYADHKEDIAVYHKQYNSEHAEARKQYDKQYRTEHAEEIKQYQSKYKTDNSERLKDYFKQYAANKRSTLEGYAYCVRKGNLRADRDKGRCGKDEDPLPPLEYYIWALQQPDFYDGKQYHWSEMGLDRIYNDKPHTFANVVPCSTKNNRRRGRKSFEEFCELMRREKEELELVLH